MSATFAFEHRTGFLPESSDELLREIPAAPGVFALRGADADSEPYLTRAADLRRRLRRLLAPPEAFDQHGIPLLSRRLNLRSKIRFIEWTRTGSEFESALLLYEAACAAFGPEQARRRLRLHPPFFLRLTLAHEHPRMYSTNRVSKRSLAEYFGPFPSRAAAERYADAVLDLFHLRRCYEDLEPYPDHPGCVYGEMNKCLQPCKRRGGQGCTPETYAAEAQRVLAFLRTRGQSLLDEVALQRDVASEGMDFEAAAALHRQWEKIRAASLLSDELVRPISELRAVVVQEAAPREPGGHSEEAAVLLLDGGRIVGPERLSTLGVRAVREQTAVGSSLFAQPLMLAAVPLEDDAVRSEEPSLAALSPEDRARQTLLLLQQRAAHGSHSLDELADALSLFRRWYYRPAKQRGGELFLPNADGSWPIRRILNGAARVVLGPPAAALPVDREAAREAAQGVKTRVLHPGREGVERIVPVLPKRKRQRPTESSQALPADDAPATAADLEDGKHPVQ